MPKKSEFDIFMSDNERNPHLIDIINSFDEWVKINFGPLCSKGSPSAVHEIRHKWDSIIDNHILCYIQRYKSTGEILSEIHSLLPKDNSPKNKV